MSWDIFHPSGYNPRYRGIVEHYFCLNDEQAHRIWPQHQLPMSISLEKRQETIDNRIDDQLDLSRPSGYNPRLRGIVEHYFCLMNEQFLRTLSGQQPPTNTPPGDTTGPIDDGPPPNDPDDQ